MLTSLSEIYSECLNRYKDVTLLYLNKKPQRNNKCIYYLSCMVNNTIIVISEKIYNTLYKNKELQNDIDKFISFNTLKDLMIKDRQQKFNRWQNDHNKKLNNGLSYQNPRIGQYKKRYGSIK